NNNNRTCKRVRADVDAFLLDLLADREFTARHFCELPNAAFAGSSRKAQRFALSRLNPAISAHPRHWDRLLALVEAGNWGSRPNSLPSRCVLASVEPLK